MIVGTIVGLLLISFILGILSVFTKLGITFLAGTAIGLFIWLAFLYWPVFPVLSIVLLILAAGRTFMLYLAGMPLLRSNLIAAAIMAGALFLLWQGLLVTMVNREVVSELEIINPDGKTGKALLVYHSKTGFTRKISAAFAKGMVKKDWRVEKTTASRKAPTDISGYDLLVLASPTYEWRPSARIQDYLKCLGDLKGKRVVIIITGEGYTVLSLPYMKKLVEKANGNIVKALEFWSLRPIFVNGEPGDPAEIAEQAGEKL